MIVHGKLAKIGVVLLLAIAPTGRASAATVGWWRFEEGAADTAPTTDFGAILDSSGLGNHATADNADFLAYSASLPGAPVDPGSVANTLSMGFVDGNNQEKVIALDSASLSLSTAITIEAFINPANLDGRDGIVYKWGAGDESYAFRLDGPNLRFVLNDGTASVGLTSSLELVANEWSHVAATWSSADSLMRLYVNGVADASTAEFDGPIRDSFSDMWIGQNTGGSPDSFDGFIDEVRISDAALAPSEFLSVPPVLTEMPDLNMDGAVDIFDVAIVSNNWGATGDPGTVEGDANKDGTVDIFDVALLSNNWDPGGGEASAVPEPSAAFLVLTATTLLAVGRRLCRR